MSGLILCREKNVRHPYYVAELGIHLYTGEELSYFVYHNILLINEDFLNDKLFDFLDELDQQKLTERLRRLKEQAGLFDALYVLLQDLHYYSGAELFQFRKQLEQLSEMTYSVRLRDKAGYLFRREQYYSALRVYDQILAEDAPELSDAEFVGGIWYSKGSCYARMENYSEALESYLKAYALLREVTMLESIYALRLFDSSLSIPEEILSLIPEEQAEQFRSNFEERKKLAVYQGKALEAAALADKPSEERGDDYLSLIHQWKEEYRRNQV